MTHLYCCRESHLPAFVSRSLVARTLIILIKRIKFTWKRKKKKQQQNIKDIQSVLMLSSQCLPQNESKGYGMQWPCGCAVCELEDLLLCKRWPPQERPSSWWVGLLQLCLIQRVVRESNGLLHESVGIPNENTDIWAIQPGLPFAWRWLTTLYGPFLWPYKLLGLSLVPRERSEIWLYLSLTVNPKIRLS